MMEGSTRVSFFARDPCPTRALPGSATDARLRWSLALLVINARAPTCYSSWLLKPSTILRPALP